MSDLSIPERVKRVRERIAAACHKAGRQPDEVQLVAVSKKQGPEKVREAAEAGLTLFGENRVQEAMAKIPECPGHLTWHLVGHLQTNKVRQAAQLFDTIHSVDSIRLLEALQRACDEAGREMRVFIEVNVSGEPAKFGVAPDGLHALLEASTACTRITVAGLMTMPPWMEEAEKARVHFAALRSLKDRARDEWGFPLEGLSMGMSHDLEVAIEEGATCVRVGTDLFS